MSTRNRSRRSPFRGPMLIYPAVHYTMGGLWVDYNLMSTVPGLFVLGEANFSDHGANRLGASALMQALADGYFIIPQTIGNYLPGATLDAVTVDFPEFSTAENKARTSINQLLACQGKRTVDDFHRQLGLLLWDYCGISRNEAGLRKALAKIPEIREEFRRNVLVPGSGQDLNQTRN